MIEPDRDLAVNDAHTFLDPEMYYRLLEICTPITRVDLFFGVEDIMRQIACSRSDNNMIDPNDSLDAIASDLDQLAEEVHGNQSRPSAEDIAARCRQAAERCRAIMSRIGNEVTEYTQNEIGRLPAGQPVVGAFVPPFAGQRVTGTHPRLSPKEEKFRSALGEDYQSPEKPVIDGAALKEAYLAATKITIPPPPENVITPENVDSFDPPADADPVDEA